MIIKTLMENTTKDCKLSSEHGLSLYIEACGHKILFDAGQTDAFAKNAEVMGVELADVDIAILSHGHYDHSGGLVRFLELNQKAKLYINEHAFNKFYSMKTKAPAEVSSPEAVAYISEVSSPDGVDYTPVLKEIGIAPTFKEQERVVITSDSTMLGEGIQLLTCNSKERQYTSNSDNLFVETEDKVEADTFLHEQYLLITEQDKRVLISGCSHKGIQNIVSWFQPDVLVGGFHFKGITMDAEGKAKLEEHATMLQKYDAKYYTCHCTGVEQYEYMKKQMGTQVEYLAAGDVIEIKAQHMECDMTKVTLGDESCESQDGLVLESGRPSNIENRLDKEIKTYDLLDLLQIPYQRVDHQAAETMEACRAIDEVLGDAVICKNLFLCNTQKTKFYLLMLTGNKQFKTKDISKQIGSARLSFAPMEYMEEFLNITPGSVSVLGLMNDVDNRVQLLVDEDVLAGENFGCHPCINTSSLKLKVSDVFQVFLKAVHHDYLTIKV